MGIMLSSMTTHTIKFASVRIATNELEKLIAFYTQLTDVTAVRLAPEFAEFRFEGATLAISSERLIKQLNGGVTIAAANRSAMLELQVDDVDAVHTRAKDAAMACAMPPTTMPWGNRSMLLRDPDGNIVNIFSRPKAG
jgi:uncharacterized glyoxalase superfamily protein PhnB